MSLNSNFIILPRREENLIAIIKCNSRGESNEAMQKIIRAITAWVVNTEYGKAEWMRTSKDLNIGDLHGILMYPSSEEYKSLVPFLMAEGVYDLYIDIFGTGDFSSDYVYDTVLVEGL